LRTGVRAKDHGVTARSPSLPWRRESVLLARHDGTRPAHSPCRLTRVMEWGLGLAGMTRRNRRKPIPRRRKLPLGIGPEEAVPARTTMDARGWARPREAPPAMWRGGSASGATCIYMKACHHGPRTLKGVRGRPSQDGRPSVARRGLSVARHSRSECRKTLGLRCIGFEIDRSGRASPCVTSTGSYERELGDHNGADPWNDGDATSRTVQNTEKTSRDVGGLW